MSKRQQVWKSLEDEEYRREYSADVGTGLAFQIKLLREKNGWTQEHLAERTGKQQETISQWENPNYGSYTLNSLKTLAAAFDVALLVKFVPFSELVEWSIGLTPQRLAPPSFTEEYEVRRVLSRLAYPPRLFATTVSEFTETFTAATSQVSTAPLPVEGTGEGTTVPPREEKAHALAA